MKLALCLFKYFPYGGMQRDFLRVALLLAEEYSVEVFTTAWEGEIPANLSVNLITVGGLTNHRRMQNFAKKALQQAKQQACEFIVGFNKMPGLDVYFAADNCYVTAAKEKHGLLYRLTPRYRTYKTLEKSVFSSNTNTKILVLTEQQKKAYQRIYQTADERFYLLPAEFNRLNHSLVVTTRPRKAVVASHPDRNDGENEAGEQLPLIDKTSTQKIRLAHDIESTDYMVLMVCSAFKTKGVDRALVALEKLNRDHFSKTHLLIIGGDRIDVWLNLARRLKIDAYVQFLGEKKNVLEYMCVADLFLHPARQEAAGKVILEAMSCGLPVLTTAECGYAEHVRKADAGILLPQENIDRLLPETLRGMLMSDAKRANWQKQALDYVENYPVADLAGEAVEVIQNAINGHG